MWIAKPIQALTHAERALWNELEGSLPLSQTIQWAIAAQSSTLHSFVVFSPNEMIGGTVFGILNKEAKGMEFECINGPFLNWDQIKDAPRQLATFAMAVSKLDQNFRLLKMKPRWESKWTASRLSHLPLLPFSQSKAATILIPVENSRERQFKAFSKRLQRTLSISLKAKTEMTCGEVTNETLLDFCAGMNLFGNVHGFFVPPIEWFKALIQPSLPIDEQNLKFKMITVQKKEENKIQSKTQILVCFRKERAHYLFGYEQRDDSLQSSLSTSALAHWECLYQCSLLGIQTYDLNGYVIDPDQNHSYYGVCQFKKQFIGSSGKIIEYDVPEFVIQ